MHEKHSPVEKFIALGVAILYFLTAVGPLDALRSLAFRLTLGPRLAYGQSNANVSVPFAPGLNLFSVPVAVPASADTCFCSQP
jgi:hypothetical protein